MTILKIKLVLEIIFYNRVTVVEMVVMNFTKVLLIYPLFCVLKE
jgi:hypothetical protein